MQLEDKGFYLAVGLARKAGKLVTGTMACTQAIKKGRVELVIATEDTAGNTLDKLKIICENSKTELIEYGQSPMLGIALGRENVKIIGIVDKDFKKLILSKMRLNGDN
ncbi:MAG: ribosomal L7Ae/L30e/S12e/Gadd45 family protein [Clostridia bacterium]|nr:ribosomal L7Ae/L30e/S12e/Gadd45 family protein [Clostridia bacterium]MBN2882340.1 ribosomal L7Ae/L30e/S12e/Gadd45 family protein [Clostridia bacterium]